MHTVSLRGARTHNLRGIDLDLDLSDRGSVIVIAGVAGAGKSSLALDTLYAEGQRRYVESFSAYARQFLERLPRPPVDKLEPIPAAIAVDRAAPVRTSRSTVGTMTEVSDYVRSLYATASRLHCPTCSRPVEHDDASAAARRVIDAHRDARVTVVYRLPVADVDGFLGVRESLVAAGYRRVLLNGEATDLDRVAPSDVVTTTGTGKRAKTKPGELVVIADRTTSRTEDRARLAEAIEAAMRHGAGRAEVRVEGGAVERFSSDLHCAYCDTSFKGSTSGLFSFNSPVGACPTCRGFGRTIEVDWDRVVPDHSLSIARGAIRPWSGKSTEWERGELAKVCKKRRVPTDVPWGSLSAEQRSVVIDGDPGADWHRGEWPGVAGWFAWMEQRTYKMHVRVLLSRYRRYEACRACGGGRLRPEASWWRIGGLSMPELLAFPAGRAFETVERWQREDVAGLASHPLARTLAMELGARLGYLRNVGLGYVTLDRSSRTLSGGESQRASLASALGATLTGALVVLDEPTVGLHPADVRLLVSAIRELAAAGNLVVVVENDAAILEAADRVIELGPGAGADGGTLVFDGTPHALVASPTKTGEALAGKLAPTRSSALPRAAESKGPAWIELRGARGNNLRGVTARFVRGGLTIVTGPSGSGKSSLVGDTLHPAVARALGVASESSPLPFDALVGVEGLAGVVLVDQSPLGRTSRGNAGTYLKLLDELRVRFAAEPEAIRRGLVASAFSFNVEGGRCEACRGEGFETVEMQLLADVSFPCVVCGGRRFKDDVLAVRHRGLTMGDVLDMTAAQVGAWLREGLDVARSTGKKARSDRALDRLQLLLDVGLGYLPLGQPLNTLSGGEAQRLKLAAAIGAATAGSLVILDEPSVGLHPSDVRELVTALDALVRRGDTVVAVEHDMSIAAVADHVIDLGPGGGDAGGEIVAQGTPEEIVRNARSATAPFLVPLGPRAFASTSASRAQGADASTRTRGARPHRAENPRAKRGSSSKDASTTLGDAPRAIHVENATEHNLRSVSIDIPREKLVVVTGPSGSGKSTLAFDVVYAEGQRRYLQTLSPYARQYLPQLPRPSVDRVVGVPPTISLEQRTAGAGGRSTVATVTEVAHYLRLVWSRAGEQWCPDCDLPVTARDRDQMIASVVERFGAPAATNGKSAKRSTAKADPGIVKLTASVIRKRKGHHGPVFERAARNGITEAVIDGTLRAIDGETRLERYALHDIDLVVAEVSARDVSAVRGGIETALAMGDGSVGVRAGDVVFSMSSRRTCPSCDRSFPEPDPRLLSFNTKEGACAKCEGHGVIDADPAVVAWKERRRKRREKQGSRGRAEETDRAPSERSGRVQCPACAGSRLSPVARAVKLGGLGVHEVLALPVERAASTLATLELSERARIVGGPALGEAGTRLSFLGHVGLGYLSLDRAAASLSGGELQRLRLAAQLGSGLTGALYVLDEPTIGLHPRDTGKLLSALRRLVTAGSTVLVVEHDADSIRAADHLIDLGPSGGRGGGHVVFEGTPANATSAKGSATGRALARLDQPGNWRDPRPVPPRSPKAAAGWTVLRGAREHNLKNVDVAIPTGRLVSVTGVSGSGKSTLVRSVLHPAVRRALGLEAPPAGAHAGVTVDPAIRRAVEVDQSPIGRTPRSVPATYIGIWDDIRALFAATPEARSHGWEASRFSFNVAGGRCEACSGQGATLAEMSFLPAVLVPCDACGGSRFTAETRSVELFGMDVAGILALTATEAATVLSSFPRIARPLSLMCDLGLGYLSIGQASNTLSGGEAQRIKIVTELAATATAGTLYVLDEPTTGLHLEDVSRLIGVLQRMVDRGDTIVVIEHHPDVIAASDWVIDLGPEGGEGGGNVVVAGPPAVVAACDASHTGAILRTAMTATPTPSSIDAAPANGEKRASRGGRRARPIAHEADV